MWFKCRLCAHQGIKSWGIKREARKEKEKILPSQNVFLLLNLPQIETNSPSENIPGEKKIVPIHGESFFPLLFLLRKVFKYTFFRVFISLPHLSPQCVNISTFFLSDDPNVCWLMSDCCFLSWIQTHNLYSRLTLYLSHFKQTQKERD